MRAAGRLYRLKQLARSDFASKARLDQAKADRDRAQAMIKSGEAALAAQRANVEVLAAQKAEAERVAGELRTKVASAERDLSFTVIHAPVDGVVGNKAAEVGMFVQPGTRLAALVPSTSIHIDANFKETQLADIGRASRCRIAVDALAGRESQARSKAWRRPRARCSACCRPRTPPATSPRSCSACRCGSPCRPSSLQQGVLRAGLSVVVDVDTRAAASHRSRPRSDELPSMSRRKPMAAAAAIAGSAAAAAPRAGDRSTGASCHVPVMVFGMFMAILDIQIVSASLAEIQAGLSASADEISWVQTSYLIAEVIMIPLSGMLSRVLSTRWMFAIAAAGFTAMSLMCALSSSIEEMIVWRALQGFIGGGMIPTVFATAYTIFPRERQSLISPIIGLVATLAPTIGPTRRRLSHRPLFLALAVPDQPGTRCCGHGRRLPADRCRRAPAAPDQGLRLVGLGADGAPARLARVRARAGPGRRLARQRHHPPAGRRGRALGGRFLLACADGKQPIVDLRAFLDRNFAVGSAFSFVVGIGLYGLTYLYPVYLGRVRGYSSLQIGETMFVTGLCMFATAPIAGRLMRKSILAS